MKRPSIRVKGRLFCLTLQSKSIAPGGRRTLANHRQSKIRGAGRPVATSQSRRDARVRTGAASARRSLLAARSRRRQPRGKFSRLFLSVWSGSVVRYGFRGHPGAGHREILPDLRVRLAAHLRVPLVPGADAVGHLVVLVQQLRGRDDTDDVLVGRAAGARAVRLADLRDVVRRHPRTLLSDTRRRHGQPGRVALGRHPQICGSTRAVRGRTPNRVASRGEAGSFRTSSDGRRLARGTKLAFDPGIEEKNSTGGRAVRRRASHRVPPARARAGSLAGFASWARTRRGPSSPRTARRSPRISPIASCSATCAGPSRPPTGTPPGSFRSRRGDRSSSARSASCRSASRPSSSPCSGIGCTARFGIGQGAEAHGSVSSPRRTGNLVDLCNQGLFRENLYRRDQRFRSSCRRSATIPEPAEPIATARDRGDAPARRHTASRRWPPWAGSPDTRQPGQATCASCSPS